MPQYRQPVSLLSLCHKQVANNLANCCRFLQVSSATPNGTQTLAFARRRFRCMYMNSLPGFIRSRLIEETCRILSPNGLEGNLIGTGPAIIYLLTILLAKDVKRLRIELCCYFGCSHQAALLRLLATEGQGLESLELARSSLLRLDHKLLSHSLLNAATLKFLTLRNITSDSVLQVIGSNCPNIIILDVSNSRQVTDTGLKSLLKSIELRDKHPSSPEHKCLRSNGCGHTYTHRPKWSNIKGSMLKMLSWLQPNQDVNRNTFLIEYREKPTTLCKKLQVFNVANTGITPTGIVLALQTIPYLQTLGEYNYIENAFEILNQEGSMTAFNLISIHCKRTTDSHLQLVAQACPRLQKISITEPQVSPSALNLLPNTLTTLHLLSVPPNVAWINQFYDYLALSQGCLITDLTLWFSPSGFLPLLDISKIVRSCPNLQVLSEDGADVEWSSNNNAVDNIPLMPNLCSIHIGQKITAEAVVELLQRAVSLKTAHFYNCPDLKDHHLVDLATKPCYGRHHTGENATNHSVVTSLFKHLECFYIYKAAHLTTSSVMALLSSCDNLAQIGNLKNWGDNSAVNQWIYGTMKENNLALETNTGSHWFNSPCFPVM